MGTPGRPHRTGLQGGPLLVSQPVTSGPDGQEAVTCPSKAHCAGKEPLLFWGPDSVASLPRPDRPGRRSPEHGSQPPTGPWV